jgi:acyl-CoA reductase-like NAD-dependent aldehyde dehydrogenase
MAIVTRDTLTATNPATGAELARIAVTPVEDVSSAVARARTAQQSWGLTSWRERKGLLDRWRRILSRDADAFADLIRDEVGKPRGEAFAGDVIGALDGLRWTIRHGGRALGATTLGPGHQRFLQMPSGRLAHRPVGVVGILGTWNYPLFLNAPPIAQALAAGNAVVWKPSELAPLVGLRLQESLEQAGLPDGLVTAVFGGPAVGRALVESEIDKGFFTGGVENGRRVLAALAARGIPAVAELSGFDAAIVLPDAPLESTARMLTWAAFISSGQTCVAVKRVFVVGDPGPWSSALATQARTLRVGNPAIGEVDLGPMISEGARDRFHHRILAAVGAGAEVLAGGSPVSGPGSFYPPTVLATRSAAPENALAGVFGPVVTVRGVADADAAVSEANASPYGLGASVWSRDLRAARAIARRLDAGMVTVNEAITPAMHASSPFGGTKASGFGRTHGASGLLEFTQPQVVFSRRPGGFRPQLFPYGAQPVEAVLNLYRRLFHPSA